MLFVICVTFVMFVLVARFFIDAMFDIRVIRVRCFAWLIFGIVVVCVIVVRFAICVICVRFGICVIFVICVICVIIVL